MRKLYKVSFGGMILMVVLLGSATFLKRQARATSFLNNDNITVVSLRVLPCEKETDAAEGKVKCKKKKTDNNPLKSLPIIISRNDERHVSFSSVINGLFSQIFPGGK